MSTVRSGYTSRRTFLGAAALATAGLAGCVGRGFRTGDVTETVTESFAASTVRELRVSNRIGDVTVTAVGSGDVGVRVIKRASRLSRLEGIDVRVDLVDGLLTVVTAVDDDARWPSSAPATDVTVTVPEGAAGPLVSEVISELGDVTLLGTRGDTVARTELGEVAAAGVDGYLTLRSGLGEVTASDVTGLDAVQTELGDLKVDLLGLRGDVEISTEMGEVVVGVADDLDLDLVAETASGVDSNLPLTGSRVVGSRLTGRQNAGGNRLHVFSELGDVSLRSVRRGQ